MNNVCARRFFGGAFTPTNSYKRIGSFLELAYQAQRTKMQTFKNTAIKTSVTVTLLFFLSGVIRPQAPQPDGGGIRPGVLPKAWLLGGPKCVEIPEFQVHEYNEDLYILR